MKPVLSKTQNGKELNNRATDPDANGKGDPFGYNDDDFSNEARKYHKALYETTEDRYVQELINVDDTKEIIKITGTGAGMNLALDKKTVKLYGPTNVAFGTKGEKLVAGYGVVYFGDETHPIAIQYKTNNEWIVCAPFDGTKITQTVTPNGTEVEIDMTGLTAAAQDEVKKIAETLEKKEISREVRMYARADLEDDFEGDYLGEVELRMSSYEFRPRPTAIGVTWSQLSEITLDTSFSVSAEEELVTYAAQEIRVALDYKAIRLGYQQACRNGSNYVVNFDAAVHSGGAGIDAFGYKQNAQTFTSAISKIEDVMLNDIRMISVAA